MATFLEKKICSDYQKEAIAKVICQGKPWPSDEYQGTKLLATWLTSEGEDSDCGFEQLISNISKYTIQHQDANANINTMEQLPSKDRKQYYYGKSGKREAVITFLTTVCNAKLPRTLLYILMNL